MKSGLVVLSARAVDHGRSGNARSANSSRARGIKPASRRHERRTEGGGAVVAHASLYAVVKFTRRGQITRAEINSLVQAMAVAKRLDHGASPVGIYCVAFNLDGAIEREVHLENYPP
jgi:hypothetical protein